MTTPDTTQLHQFLVDHFDLDELETLCLHLKIRSDDLGGKGLTGKARELVLYVERHGRLVDLRAVLGQQRPDLYRAAFGEAATRQTVTGTSPRRDRRHAERNPKQIFVSHAVANAEAFAHRLADDLRRAGYTIWIAPESIPDGQWVSAINRGLAESGIMLLVLTPGALESPWVEMETNVAIELERAGEMRFIPVCLEKARYDPVLRAYQWVMFDPDYTVGLNELLARLSPAPLPPSTPALPDRRIHEKTGIELIRIPAGLFIYGEGKTQRTIELPEYWIGRFPVTNRQYKAFLDANSQYPLPYEKWGGEFNWDYSTRSYPTDRAEDPVVLVSWSDAIAFCRWAGMRLPNEEEWEKAARGIDGRRYPWGNERPTKEHCNFNNYYHGTTAVGQFSPKGDSPYGCADMVGNTWEWTATVYSEGSEDKTCRGGAWGHYNRDVPIVSRHYRPSNPPNLPDFYIGFRVAELLSDSGF